MPKISVIVPVYNVEQYLKICLDSILAQTFQDFEIICINDGSTDNSLKILEEYKQLDDRLVILTQTQSGAAIARNNGIKQSKGEYIQFLDSDDYVEPNLLEEMYKRARTHQADLVVCSYKKVDDNGNITERKNPNSPINLYKTPLEKPFCANDFKEDIFSLLTPGPVNKLYKKELIIENDITFPNIRICEDIAFVHSCVAVAKKILVFDEALINYRFNRPGSMASYRKKYTIDVVHSCNALKNFLVKKNLYSNFKTAFFNAFKNHIRWEITLCSDEEYQNFLTEFKQLMPNDWELFKPALRKDYLTLDYLKKFIGNKKVMLWGASFFIQKLLEQETEPNPNILGIIDKNTASWGQTCANYKIFPPDSLLEIKPDGVIMTIWSNYEFFYPALQEEFKKNYPDVELLPNIFEEEMVFE